MNFETMHSLGYDLYQPFAQVDQWVIDLKNGNAYHGTSDDVINFMINKLKFDLNEVIYALDQADLVGNNAAHFGIFKTFIYSFDKNVDLGEIAS